MRCFLQICILLNYQGCGRAYYVYLISPELHAEFLATLLLRFLAMMLLNLMTTSRELWSWSFLTVCPWDSYCLQQHLLNTLNFILSVLKYLFMYLGLSFMHWVLVFMHWVLVADTGSLILTCQFLVAAHGIEFPDQGLNSSLLHWEHGVFSHWTTWEIPLLWIFKLCSMDHQRRAS